MFFFMIESELDWATLGAEHTHLHVDVWRSKTPKIHIKAKLLHWYSGALRGVFRLWCGVVVTRVKRVTRIHHEAKSNVCLGEDYQPWHPLTSKVWWVFAQKRVLEVLTADLVRTMWSWAPPWMDAPVVRQVKSRVLAVLPLSIARARIHWWWERNEQLKESEWSVMSACSKGKVIQNFMQADYKSSGFVQIMQMTIILHPPILNGGVTRGWCPHWDRSMSEVGVSHIMW